MFLLPLIIIVASIANLSADGRAIKDEEESNGLDNKTCSSHECKVSMRYVTQHINRKAEPCNGFYEFACGRARDGFILGPNGRILDNPFSYNTDEAITRSQELLTEVLSKSNSSDRMKRLAKYYGCCLNDCK